jgi:hypothetical protein
VLYVDPPSVHNERCILAFSRNIQQATHIIVFMQANAQLELQLESVVPDRGEEANFLQQYEQ